MSRRAASTRTGARRATVSRALSRGKGHKHRTARIVVGRLLLVGALALATLKLVEVQTIEGPRLTASAEDQRTSGVAIPAERGTITDVKGTKLAFSVDSVALTAQPRKMRANWDQSQRSAARAGKPTVSYDEHARRIAAFLAARLGPEFDRAEAEKDLRSNTTFTYLDETVDPPTAKAIRDRFPDIGQEKRSQRRYPGGTVGSNIVGVANWRKDTEPPKIAGLAGLESAMNQKLSGRPGRELVDTGAGSDVVIPGTERDIRPAVPGSDVRLTIDSDVQYQAQRLLRHYREKVKARAGSIAVLDSRTGKVVALANDHTFNPNDPSTWTSKNMTDSAVTSPFEPGSVGKMLTAAGALEDGVVRPDSVLSVPDHVQVADRTVHDDWSHPRQDFTFTGILAKSSNVGILKVASRLGKDEFAKYLHRFGVGKRTGIGLPGESPGSVPPREDWSASTFANLPFGQGYSMTTLQLASAFQAIANGGVRVPPRILASTTGPAGTVHRTPRAKGVRVVSERTADTLVGMLRGVTQDEPSPNRGTAPSAALDGYQIAGKTGTAQQIDPKTGAYSQSKVTTTFVGILPADHPRFVAAIMLDRPTGVGGSTAAPLFHDLASYLTQRYNLPLSKGKAPKMKFVLP